jgi:GNAT superfamily N-acetyltransferase
LAFAPADPTVPPASELLAEMVAELRQLYQVDGGHIGVPLEIHELAPPGGVYLVGLVEGAAVAGGGVRTIGTGTGEVKRMYVRPAWRSCGVGAQLLTALEAAATEAGLRRLRLDTGPLQASAQRLYERSGYRRITDYNGNQHASYWAEKTLDGPGPPS